MKKLLNPIEFFNDQKLLFANLIIFVVGTTLAIFLRTVFFSTPIDLHFDSEINAGNTLLGNLSAVTIITILLLISGKIINVKTRFIDCLNLALYIRIPYYILTLFNITGTISDLTSGVIHQNMTAEELYSSSATLIILTLFSILALVALALKALMVYFGFKTITNAKKISDYLILVGLFIMTQILLLFLF